MSEALTAESLSGPLRSVAERLGMPFVFRLVEHFGGTTVAIPSGSAGKKQYRRLCEALGDESASALCREFARRAIYIPNLKQAMLDKRNSSLNMERDELAGRGHSERTLVCHPCPQVQPLRAAGMAHPEAAEDSGGGNAMSDTCTFAEFLDHCTGRKVMPPPAQAKKRPSCPPESEEQKALFDWWQRTPYARHFVMYHIPNGGRRDKITGARLKAEGVVAGVPDVFLASPRQGFHGLYIEMKRQRGGTVQATQKELITALRQAGYRVEVCMGWWEAREVIENYLTGEIPKGASRRVEPAANQQPLADRRGRRAVQGR